MDPKNRNNSMDDITDDLIVDAAKEAAVKAGEEDKLPARLRVDPEAVANGDELDEEEELDENGKPKKKDPDPDEEPAYVPDDEEEPDEGKKPVSKVDPELKHTDKPKPADDEDVEAFAQSLRDDGYDEPTVKAMLKAVELGGKVALKRVQAAAEADKTAAAEAEDQRQAAFASRKRKEYVAVGNLQNEGRLPKVPVAIQKKIVEGKGLTAAEKDHAGVKRQNEVWSHMTTQNREAIERGEDPYLLTFRTALADLEATEARAGKVDNDKAAIQKKKAQSSLLKGGSGKAAEGTKSTKPKYIAGQTLDDVTADIMAELDGA